MKPKRGIYAITLKASAELDRGTSDRYIGRAENIDKRWHNHRRKLVAGRHKNSLLQGAWNTYGADAFEWDKGEAGDEDD